MIVKARIGANITVAWRGANFSRADKLKDLEHYLKPARKPSREQGARDVKRMFDRMIAKQGGG